MSSDEQETAPNGAEATASPALDSPALPVTPGKVGFTPLVTVVGFHHARGPEVETWFGVEDGFDPAAEFKWSLLPFMALSDGAHASEEDFSYFTLLKPETEKGPATSLFGISCTRQMDASLLINRPEDVTRSTVQKAVVVIADSPKSFGMLRERLGIVTHAWFEQRDFTDSEILKRFQESLAEEKSGGTLEEEADRDQYIGMSLRELIHEFKWQTLVLLKGCLLQPKMLFFGSRCDRLCMVQFALISLIPGLMRHLQDCADPELSSYEGGLSKPTSLQSSNRNSLLSFMGLPLQLFGKGSLFGPYTPLQQLDILADFGTKSYIVGSTNSLLLQQKDRYSDILINLDEDTVNITSASLKNALALTAADRRWIDGITHEINETWDDANPSRPKNMQYTGSEEYIRAQFEAYVLGLISSVKYHNFIKGNPDSQSPAEADPAIDFGLEWVEAWSHTENYRMWNDNTDANLFAVSVPKHPSAGGLTMDDVQRRIADQVKDLHLDERFAQGREVLGRNFAAGREKASTMLSRIYSDVEYLRESQRRRAEDAARTQGAKSPSTESSASAVPAVDLATVQKTAQTAGARASAYMSSWASWAGERRKNGGWGGGWGKKTRSDKNGGDSTPASPIEKQSGDIDRDYQMVNAPTAGTGSSEDASAASRHGPQPSFSESILSGVSSSPSRPKTGENDPSPPAEKADPVAAPTKDVDAADVKGTAAAKEKSDGFEEVDIKGGDASDEPKE